MPPHVDKEIFLDAMSAVPGPVALITTKLGDRRGGLTVSSFSSVSADPPSVVVCINKNASAHDMLLDAGVFGANLLRPDQSDLATLFTQKGVDRFIGNEWRELRTGAPILTTSLAAFDCRVASTIDGFSHTLVIGLVEQVAAEYALDAECLIWHRRCYRTSSVI